MEKNKFFPNNSKYAMAIVFVTVILLIFTASFLRYLNMYALGFSPLRSFIQSFIYIGIFLAWGISIKNRILKVAVRRMLMAADALMLLWMVSRTLKYLLVMDPDITRYLWYSYYIPIFLIPFFSFCAALSLGRPDTYRLPDIMKVFLIIGLVLVVAVMTNDVHQLFFRFGDSSPVYSDKDFTHGILFFAGMLYTVSLTVMSFVVMIKRCRIYKNRHLLWIPLGALAFIFIYCTVYVLDSSIVRSVLGDFPVTICLLVMIVLEGCIQTGLIGSNAGYSDLLRRSTINIRILDKQKNTVYVSDIARELEKDTVDSIIASGQKMTDEDMLIKSQPITGGYVLWSEDLSELNAMINDLKGVRKELSESVNLQKEKNEAQRSTAVLRERNRIYQMVLQRTSPQLDYLRTELGIGGDPILPRETLLKLAVLATYVKRMGNLILIAETEQDTDAAELELCFEESFENLRLFDVVCSCKNKGVGSMGTSDAARIYEFFEKILESALPEIYAIQLFLEYGEKGIITFRMMMEGTPDIALVPEDTEYSLNEDGVYTFIFRIGEGE